MPQAQITINAVAGSNIDLPINALVQLSNNNIGGEVSYSWAILDQPPGAADALSSTTILSPTFTPKKEGSYLLRLIVNLGQPTEDRDQVVAAVLQLKTRIRVPAAGETTEVDVSDGWATSADEALRLIDTARADPGVQVCQVAGAGVAVNDVVRFVGTAIIKAALPGAETVLTVDEALATVNANVDEPLGLVLGTIDGSAVAVGKLVLVRRFGLRQNVSIVGAAVGNSVYCSNTGVLALAPGTAQRLVGRVVAVPSGVLADVYFDGAIWDYQVGVTLSNVVPTTIDPDAPSSAGVGLQASRDDHAHTIPVDVPGAILVGDVAAAGVASKVARADHKHSLAAPAAPQTVGTANATGAATAPARADHVHDHGAQTSGTLHAVVTTSVAGFMSAADKTLFDALGLATGSVTTVDATATAIQTIAIAAGTVVEIAAKVAGRNTAGSEGAGYYMVGTYRNDAGVVTQIGQNNLINHEDTPGWACTLVVSGTNVIVQVTGQAAKTINWKSRTDKIVAP